MNKRKKVYKIQLRHTSACTHQHTHNQNDILYVFISLSFPNTSVDTAIGETTVVRLIDDVFSL